MDSHYFRIGDVLHQSGVILRRHFRQFAAVALLLVGVPSAALNCLVIQPMSLRDFFLGARYEEASVLAQAGLDMDMIALIYTAGAILTALLAMLLYGSVVGGVARAVDGQPLTVRRLLSLGADGMSVVFRVVVLFVMLIIGLLFAMGVVMLIIGALVGDSPRSTFTMTLAIGLVFFSFFAPLITMLVLVARWALVVPAAMLEDRGVIEALGRSARLGVGERWRMIGLVLLIATAGLVALSIMEALLFFVSGSMKLAVILAAVLLQCCFAVFTGIVFTIAYIQLRRAKEGDEPGTVARVFD